METVRWAKDRRYIKYFFLLSLSYDTFYDTCNKRNFPISLHMCGDTL